MRGKLIVIEGTDCSGKETQSNLLIDRLRKNNVRVEKFSFPNYNSPTGKIIGGPFLGKSYICEGWFNEGASNVDPKVASLYYAADRKYNIDKINLLLENGMNVILDRYIYSNMAHQGCKINSKNERIEMFKWLEELEFNLLALPKPDISIFLHMPTEQVSVLKSSRLEALDQNEADTNYLKKSEQTYIELSKIYEFKTIECYDGEKIRSVLDINDEIYDFIYPNIVKINSN